MDTGFQSQEKVPESLRKHLAIAVRSIQWSYSIFWSSSSSEPGVLKWAEGYYNGDIKTRKTVQHVELNVDQMGLQRSEQLRELYESLVAGESSPQARRPSAALSPEDLSNAEWYYLVCMSFVFNPGEGLPGKTVEIGEPIWLCNAHRAESRVFNRSLLAKSASIQTVVCFPFLGGVVELGVTDLVPEDLSLIQDVQASLMGTDCPTLSQRSISIIHHHNNEILDNALTPLVLGEELRLLESPDNSSNGFGLIQPIEEAKFMIEGPIGELIDDELSNCVYTSVASSDCISQNLIHPENPVSLSKTKNVEEVHPQGKDIQGQCVDDLHYQNVLAALFKRAHELILEPPVCNRDKKSCFRIWKKGFGVSCHNPRNGYPQRILKKILFEVPRMHGNSSTEHKLDGFMKDKLWKPEADELATNHVLAERRRRERVNDRFSTLKSLIPSIDKVDKVSILDDTIEYLKELERRVDELETCRDLEECSRRRTGSKAQDAAERTSDNYGDNRVGVKRKAEGADDEGKLENSLVSLRDSSSNTNLSISLIQKDVLIEIRCPWKECLLLEIIDALSNIRLDTYSVESSTSDGFLSLTVKAKIRSSGGLSAGMIRQVLQRVLINRR